MDRVPDDELISAYLDDELSTEERAYVERLLVERPEARRLLEELRGVRESLQVLPSYRLEPDFSATVLRQAEREVLRSPANGQTANGQVADSKANIVEPRRDVVESDSAGSSSGGSSVSPLPDIPRWRRPLAWSILTVAAAAVLMFVNRQIDQEKPIALNDAKQDATPHDEREKETIRDLAGKASPEFTADDLVRMKANAPSPATPTPESGRDGLNAAKVAGSGGATVPANDAPLLKFAAPNDQPAGGAFNVGQNAFAGQPTAPPAGHMSVANSINAPAAPPTGAFAVDNRILSKAGAGTLELNGANTFSGTAGAQGLSTLQSQTPSSQIDTKPLVAANDFQRAQTLVAEWNEARRVSKSDDEAARAFTRRAPAQVAQTENAPRQEAAVSQANDQLLIVTIEVPNEAALERCLLPVLQQQQIADLTTLRSRADVALQLSNISGNYGPPAEAATRDADAATQPQEEYVYVVAGSQQLEATLDALRKQTDTIVDLEVEPAPANLRQQAWSGYSRGYNDGEKAKSAFESSSIVTAGVAGQPVAAPAAPAMALPAAPVAVAAPANEGLIAKKSEAESQERKNAEGADKQLQLNGIVGNRSSNMNVQSDGAVADVVQQQVVRQQGSSYGGNLVPLSRSQRLRGVDAAALQIASQSGPEAASQARARFSVQDRIAGQKSQSAAGGGGPSVAAAPGAVETPSPAAAPGSAPTMSSTPIAASQPLSVAAKAKDDVSKATGDQVGENPALGVVAQTKQATDPGVQMPLQQQFGYELPPDFHEALFICRVAPSANVAAPAKPAADAKPPATAPSATPSATPARSKAE